jgi:GTP1/Obg family GTP-binding protein
MQTIKESCIRGMTIIMKRQAADLTCLGQFWQHLSPLPLINPYMRTIFMYCGFPNVGKSSLINKVKNVI